METVIFRGKIPDSIHFFNTELISYVLHRYNASLPAEELAHRGLVFAPLYEMCEITQETTCIGIAASGRNVLSEITLPTRLKAAFTAQRIEVPSDKGNSIRIKRVNRRSKAYFDQAMDYLVNQKKIPKQEAKAAVRKMKLKNRNKNEETPFFWYANDPKAIRAAVYIRAQTEIADHHTTKNTMGAGITQFHPRITEREGKLLLNQ